MNVSRRFFCSRIHLTNARSDFCWHPLWSVIMVQDPKACIAGHKFKFMKPTLSRRNQHEKKAQRPMPVSVHLASEQLLDFPNYSRTVAIDKSLETQENRHKKVQDGDSSENLNAFSDIPAAVSELKAIQADSMRSKLVCKLSEANQYGRNLQRKVQETNETLSKCKGELAMMEVELQMLVQLAQEIARAGGKSLSKINGRYISSHLASRLEDLHKRVLSQIKDVDAMRLRDVPLQWYGMAESVQVMGSFDGWTQGKHMSPENTIAHTVFTTTLNLRPGRYEIKFIVEGIWRLSPQLPTVGEGTTINNLLLVE
ncbi:hypothetical protein O6H91_02G104300 [Diphasiastrum complanatum]|uniref:Uncharacterized protein n=1 Tax=Diphasiastrum complanatum TaxID=34168 RepID=A0ACC2EJ74_DIPCM|nr:hypothetical protein O6H91_02G104300 [Diphasiastrum complanatum]